MARSIDEEVKRAKAAGEATKSAFSTAIRDVELNNIKDGDVLVLAANYTVIDRPIRGTEDTAELIYVKCLRPNAAGGTTECTVPLYPSFFWKRRRVADERSKMPTDTYVTSNGEVVDFIQTKGDLNEAIKAIATEHPNGIRVKYGTEKCLRYGQPEDGTGKLQNANVPTLTWAL